MEYIAMRHDLIHREIRGGRFVVSPGFKAFWLLFRRAWPHWRRVCVTVRPETVIRWHRAGFRLFWKIKFRRTDDQRSKRCARQAVIALIQRMAQENPTWGAPRVHGELCKLGFATSQRTVSRLMPKRPHAEGALERRRQSWRTFLNNHREVIAAMDFLVVPTWNFRLIYVLVILDHGRCIVQHFNVTGNPTAEWVKQQLREAFPFDEKPRFLIHDRDRIFHPLKAFLESFGIQPKLTAFHCPWQNGYVERVNGSIRRDLLDHVIPLNEEHLRRLLKEYLRYYHEDRTHLGLDKDAPRGSPVEVRQSEDARVDALPRCGGLHHRYRWREAA